MKDPAPQDLGDSLQHLPMVPLRDVVVFPYTMVPFVVGRRSSLAAVENALGGSRRIFLATQRNAKIDDPKPEDINSIGTIANIVQSLKLPNGNIKLLVEGLARARVIELDEAPGGYLQALLKVVERKSEGPNAESEAVMQKVASLFEKYVKFSPNLPYETMLSTIRVTEPGRLTDTIAAHLTIGVEEKQNLLETVNPRERLEVMPPVSAEATVSRNYLEWLLALPWAKKSRELKDIAKAEKILNEDHYGLDKVKERILEFLAVRQLVSKTKGSILCFVGPPGVGKTSLAKSIARATGRKFVRLSLGGVRDEAEIRGHRRTYIGAFPGQVIQMMRKAGMKNPVFLLDEVDKMSMDFRGDPSAALLEVLDPEQNNVFLDHYIDTEFDLSEVMFIATANVIHTVPAALKDRMEVIRLAGYTLGEKIAIAQRYLVRKQLTQHGLDPEKIAIDEDAIRDMIENYTREAGVRSLEREIASICRKIARKVVSEGGATSARVTSETVSSYLGVPRFHPQAQQRAPEVGTATGLAWTEVGGEILMSECSLVPGKGILTLTGKLGDVMQESAQAALTFIRSRAAMLAIEPNFYRKYDIHIHVPEGAIPKDGPSAGITMATALASLLTKVPVRSDVAMTGEITLRGKVLPIGGVKEKVLAAYRYGVRTIILPKENEKDLSEVPEEIQKLLDFKLVETMDEVLDIALVGGRKSVTEPESLPSGDKGVGEEPLAH